MTIQEATNLLPIIKALSEGKTIQQCTIDDFNEKRWEDILNPTIDLVHLLEHPKNYRVKPILKFRPFENAKECLAEMKKHTPFGYIRFNSSDSYYSVTEVYDDSIKIAGNKYLFDRAFVIMQFLDGIPFGRAIKVEYI